MGRSASLRQSKGRKDVFLNPSHSITVIVIHHRARDDWAE